MNKKLIGLAALLLTFTFNQTAIACPTTHAESKDCACAMQKNNPLNSHLNLTTEQKAKIKALKTQNHAAIKAHRQQLRAIDWQIKTLITADKMDETKLATLIKQKNEIRGELMKNHVVMQYHIYQLLDAKQKQQYLQKQEHKS